MGTNAGHSTITTSFQDHILHIRLNRPEQHNAFDVKMISELIDTLSNADTAFKDLRGILLSGEGPSFCAGADLKWMKSMANFSFEENSDDAGRLFHMFESFRNCKVPVVARIHGNVMGGGLGLLAVCDVVAAHRDTKFCFSEVKLGLIPSVISAFFNQRFAAGFYRPLMLTGEIFGVDRAQAMGLVHFVGETEEIEDFAAGQVDFLRGNGPEAVRALKGLLNFEENADWDTTKRETIRLIAERRVSREGQEGLTSFFEKRKPSWKKH